MADEELAALRQQRLAELQAKHGVRRGARHTAAPCGRGSGAGRGGAARGGLPVSQGGGSRYGSSAAARSCGSSEFHSSVGLVSGFNAFVRFLSFGKRYCLRCSGARRSCGQGQAGVAAIGRQHGLAAARAADACAQPITPQGLLGSH